MGAAAVAPLTAALADDNPGVRRAAARSLGTLGRDAPCPALPALEKAVSDPEEGVRTTAAKALELLRAE